MRVACRPPQDNPKTLNTQLYIQLYEKKLKRFEQFAKLYPECYWVFVGDNGQVGLPWHMLGLGALQGQTSPSCRLTAKPFCICSLLGVLSLLMCRSARCFSA